MPDPTPPFVPGDWYDLPAYYDAIFDQDTALEADFLEAVSARFGRGNPQNGKPLRILEPACGSGRLVLELAKRRHHVEGFDASKRMLDAARRKFSGQNLKPLLRLGRMENMPSKARFDLVHCLLSTFKYVATERDAAAHLRQATRLLIRGGLYVLGIHLTDYNRTRAESEKWTAQTDHFHVTCVTTTFPPDERRRSERLQNQLTVRFTQIQGQRRTPPERIETRWRCRTYDAAQLRSLLAKIPELECVACYDFTYDLSSPRAFDDSQDDLLLILRKR